jgi:hypothetical protein
MDLRRAFPDDWRSYGLFIGNFLRGIKYFLIISKRKGNSSGPSPSIPRFRIDPVGRTTGFRSGSTLFFEGPWGRGKGRSVEDQDPQSRPLQGSDPMDNPWGKKDEILRADYGLPPFNLHLGPSLEDEECLLQVGMRMGIGLAAEFDLAEDDFHPV